MFALIYHGPITSLTISYDTADQSFYINNDGTDRERHTIEDTLAYIVESMGHEWLQTYPEGDGVEIAKRLLAQELATLAQISAGTFLLRSL
jgi:hypothetical protein